MIPRRDRQPSDHRAWWHADKGQVWERVLDYVATVERAQSDIYTRFIKLAALYDPNGWNNAITAMRSSDEILGQVTENVVASNVDTVTAVIASTDVRARFMTDDADWSTQRLARQLEWYAEAVGKQLGIPEVCRKAFKSGALKGTGLVKVYIDQFDQIRTEHVMVDDVIVDEVECRAHAPRQLHQRNNIDREILKAEFPEYEMEIERAQSGRYRNWRMWAGYRPLQRNEIVIIESWHLPIGVQDAPNYKPGRHTITIDGCDLVDEEYNEARFPFARFVWAERASGWYGISGAERIAGHQRALNKRNWQIDRQLDQGAIPTTYVRLADAALSVKTVNRLGTIAVYKSEKPETVIPPAVSPETYQSRQDLKAAAFEEFGVSQMAARATKPAGIDSGVAMREYRDQTTQRFATQEKAYEQLVLDVVQLVLGCCKKLGSDAPVIMRRTKFGAKRIKWSQVDLGDVQVQIAAASTLARTPAGREQAVIEWAQAGVISQDEARRLLRHPDLERAMSIYTEALENVENCLEEIADGSVVLPEPFMNLKMCVWRGQMQYLLWRDEGAPEEVLESVRQFVVQAAWMIGQATQPANQNAAPGMPGAVPGAPPAVTGPGGPMPPMAAPPIDAAPQAAFAPQAMQLMAK